MREDLRLAGIFGVACALATALLFPYLMLVMPQALAKVPLPIPLLGLVPALPGLLLRRHRGGSAAAPVLHHADCLGPVPARPRRTSALAPVVRRRAGCARLRRGA